MFWPAPVNILTHTCKRFDLHLYVLTHTCKWFDYVLADFSILQTVAMSKSFL